MGTVQAKILEIIADEPFTTREELIKDYGIKYSSGSHSIVGPLQALVRRQFLSEKNGSFVITDKGTEMLTKIRAGEIRLHTGRGVTHASK